MIKDDKMQDQADQADQKATTLKMAEIPWNVRSCFDRVKVMTGEQFLQVALVLAMDLVNAIVKKDTDLETRQCLAIHFVSDALGKNLEFHLRKPDEDTGEIPDAPLQ